MRFTFVLSFSLVFSGLVSGTEYSSNMFDNVDVDKIITNNFLFNQYVNCFLDKDNCTADGRSIKSDLPDIIATCCEKCSEKQKQNTKKLIDHLKKEEPDLWKEFQERYDPDSKHEASCNKFWAQERT